jgi:nucleoside-diphosphate-sugar epimerase
VDGLILTSENETCYDEIELGRGNNYSINELADMLSWNIQYIDARPGEAKETLCNISVAKRLIGYEPTRNIEDYIEGVTNETN